MGMANMNYSRRCKAQVDVDSWSRQLMCTSGKRDKRRLPAGSLSWRDLLRYEPKRHLDHSKSES